MAADHRIDIKGLSLLAAIYDETTDEPPTGRDTERHSRMDFDGQRYGNCRQRDKGNGACLKHDPGECKTCRTCPVCGGTLAHTFRDERIAVDVLKRYTIASCIQCGAYMERDIHRPVRVAPSPTKDGGLPPICAVRGCSHRAWTGYSVEVAGRGYQVCDYHKRQHQRWIRGGSDVRQAHLIVGPAGTLEKTWRRK